MTPMQHRAVLVCVLCVLAVLLTFGITTTLLKKEESAPSVPESVADPTPGKDLSGRPEPHLRRARTMCMRCWNHTPNRRKTPTT